MADLVLADTSALVAVLDRSQAEHQPCRRVLSRLHDPLVTCWPVLAEAIHLLRRVPGGAKALFGLIDSGTLRVTELDPPAIDWISTFFEKYRDQRPDLADACLVYLVAHERGDVIFTLDRRDFTIFRAKGRPLRLLP